MNEIQKEILKQVADIEEAPAGAYNIRVDGQSIGRKSSQAIDISPREDGQGLTITIAPDTDNEYVHIPVVIGQSGITESVLNDFYIGKNAKVTIIAGCGIHTGSDEASQHDGIHSFYLEEGAHVTYEEKHYGTGAGTGKRVLNPVTKIFMKENSFMQMNSIQIEGVDSTKRATYATLKAGAQLQVRENLMTHDEQSAETLFEVELKGDDCKAHVVSRSVAKDHSTQTFISKMDGLASCSGRTECDAIIMGDATVKAIPEITAAHIDASLVHEAAIGRIAGEQLTKLMTLGLTQEEAEEQIIKGFLK